VMVNRSDRDPPNLNVLPSFELSGEMRRGSANPSGPAGFGLQNRPDINLQPYLSIITPNRPCTSGGVHISHMKRLLALALFAPLIASAGTAFDGSWLMRLDSVKVSGKPDVFVIGNGT